MTHKKKFNRQMKIKALSEKDIEAIKRNTYEETLKFLKDGFGIDFDMRVPFYWFERNGFDAEKALEAKRLDAIELRKKIRGLKP